MKKSIALIGFIAYAGICFTQTVFGLQQIISTDVEEASSVFAIDLDNDGDNDVLSASFYDNKIAWYENDGQGNIGDQQIITTSADGAYDVFSIDLDNDNDNDVLSATNFNDKVYWYENDGQGNFGNPHTVSSNILGARSVFSIDLDGDNDNDVLSASEYDNKIAWFENDGQGNFGNQQIISSNAFGANTVFSIDLDNDNDNDVLVSMYTDKIVWFENDGQGNFGVEKIITATLTIPNCVFAIDLDNDGDNDVLASTIGEENVVWFENNGNGSFGNHQVISMDFGSAYSVFAIDLDNDNDNDVLSASVGVDEIVWFENDGQGNFGSYQTISSDVDGPISVFSIDLDNDNDNDVLSASSYDNKIAWYENYYNKVYFLNGDICEGDSLLINNEWIFLSGLYHDTLVNSLGGDSIIVYTIELIPNPESFNIIGSMDVEEFESETYSVPVNPDVTYSFEVENGNIINTQENSVEIQWGESGIGLITATATFNNTGCYSTTTLEVTVSSDDINEYNNNIVQLYPNPANNKLLIETDLSSITIEIINNTGQMVITSNFKQIDISRLESNIYFVKVFDKRGNLILAEKLVISR